MLLMWGGVFRNKDNKIVIKKELIFELNETIGNKEIVIKPTVETGSGKNVRFIRFENGLQVFTGLPIEIFLDQYGENWNIQEVIYNPPILNKIYPSAVNTFRVITYIWEGKIYTTPLSLRIGRNGNRLDNAHANGIFVGCTDDGYLKQWAFSEFQEKFEEHPDTGVRFDGYYIPEVPKILDCAKNMHSRFPQLGIISWDMSLDEEDNVVLIEINTIGQGSWLPQMANGEPLFRENTAEILRSMRK